MLFANAADGRLMAVDPRTVLYSALDKPGNAIVWGVVSREERPGIPPPRITQPGQAPTTGPNPASGAP